LLGFFFCVWIPFSHRSRFLLDPLGTFFIERIPRTQRCWGGPCAFFLIQIPLPFSPHLYFATEFQVRCFTFSLLCRLASNFVVPPHPPPPKGKNVVPPFFPVFFYVPKVGFFLLIYFVVFLLFHLKGIVSANKLVRGSVVFPQFFRCIPPGEFLHLPH